MEKVFVIFCVLILSAIYAGFDRDYSDPVEHSMACGVCRDNGGYVEYGYGALRAFEYRIVCNDGAVFYKGDRTYLEYKKKYEEENNKEMP